MKKVVLLGDSIRLVGYGKRCAELLGDGYETVGPEDNGRFVKYTLRGVLYEWKPILEGADLIHWNNGLWDICDLGDGPFTDLDEYIKNMRRVARVLLGYTDKVIFATTTPVSPKMWGHDINRTMMYNKAAVEALSEYVVAVNDLFSTVKEDTEGNICDDLLHLSPKGIELCAEQTADIIRKTLSSD